VAELTSADQNRRTAPSWLKESTNAMKVKSMTKHNSSSFISGRELPKSKRKLPAVPRVILVPLACVGILVAGVSRTSAAAAAIQVPYEDSYEAQVVSEAANPDGTHDYLLAGVGIGTHVGSFTVLVLAHTSPITFDPASNSLVRQFTFSETRTTACGDTLLSSVIGTEVAPLPLTLPYSLAGSQTITGGTGRFSGATGNLIFTGLDLGSAISVSMSGTISTVGSNKTSD
jgi:hypothetical protein